MKCYRWQTAHLQLLSAVINTLGLCASKKISLKLLYYWPLYLNNVSLFGCTRKKDTPVALMLYFWRSSLKSVNAVLNWTWYYGHVCHQINQGWHLEDYNLRELYVSGIPGSVHGSGEGGGSRLAAGRQTTSSQGRAVLKQRGLEGHVGLLRRGHLSVPNTYLLIIS